MNNTFGEFLSRKRKEVGLTQKELAEKLFISESAVSKWEKNKSNPDISMIGELSKILNVSEHELITASEDREYKKEKAQARKWRNLTKGFNLFFYISFSIALLTCFICNLAVDKKLSWFFIVLTALVLASSFVIFPQYVKKYRLFIISITELLSLILLLITCCVYVKGSWIYLSVTPIITAYIIVFLPIFIAKYDCFKSIKRHGAIISVIVDIIAVSVMVLIIERLTKGSWFISFYMPIMGSVAVFTTIFVLITCYLKTPKLIKASILTVIFIPFSIVEYLLTQILCLKVFNEKIDEITLPNFSDWATDINIKSNVFALIEIALLTVSVITLTIYLIKRKKK